MIYAFRDLNRRGLRREDLASDKLQELRASVLDGVERGIRVDIGDF